MAYVHSYAQFLLAPGRGHGAQGRRWQLARRVLAAAADLELAIVVARSGGWVALRPPGLLWSDWTIGGLYLHPYEL